MAHFAELDENNTVTRIVVVNNAVLSSSDTNPGIECESVGVEFLNSLFGYVGNWRMTSYSGSFRKQYAGVGETYNSQLDAFISRRPFLSWNLDSNGDWQPPIPKPLTPPEGGGRWAWNEAALCWVSNKSI